MSAKEEAVYQQFDIVVKTTNALLQGAFKTIFLESFSGLYVGLATCLPIEILKHLYTLYAFIYISNLITTNEYLVKDLDAIRSKLLTFMINFDLVTQKLSDCRAVNKGGRSGHSSLNKYYCWSCRYISDLSSWYCTVTNPNSQKGQRLMTSWVILR